MSRPARVEAVGAPEAVAWPRRKAAPIWAAAQGALSFVGSDSFVTDAMEAISRAPVVGTAFAQCCKQHILRRARATGTIFIHVPRNAGTSVSRALYRDDIPHFTAQFLKRLDPRAFSTYRSFCVLRDPCDRFLSTYSFVNSRGTELTRMHPAWAAKLRGWADVDGFLDFLESARDRLGALDYVLRPQADFVLGGDGRLLVERAFLFGRDMEALRSFVRARGGDELHRLNASEPVAVALSSRQKARVRALYARDCKLLARLWPETV